MEETIGGLIEEAVTVIMRGAREAEEWQGQRESELGLKNAYVALTKI